MNLHRWERTHKWKRTLASNEVGEFDLGVRGWRWVLSFWGAGGRGLQRQQRSAAWYGGEVERTRAAKVTEECNLVWWRALVVVGNKMGEFDLGIRLWWKWVLTHRDTNRWAIEQAHNLARNGRTVGGWGTGPLTLKFHTFSWQGP